MFRKASWGSSFLQYIKMGTKSIKIVQVGISSPERKDSGKSWDFRMQRSWSDSWRRIKSRKCGCMFVGKNKSWIDWFCISLIIFNGRKWKWVDYGWKTGEKGRWVRRFDSFLLDFRHCGGKCILNHQQESKEKNINFQDDNSKKLVPLKHNFDGF